MHQHDVLQAWITGITKTGTEDEQVGVLVDILDSLLSLPAAQRLQSLKNHQARLQAHRVRGFGINDLTNTIIDVSTQLQRV